MVTIKDIAKEAGISKSTVSRVVSNSGFVKGETREKIERVMEELNYRPNMFAKGMRTKKSHSIGILFPDFSNPYFAEWYEIVDKLARENGYLNYICITDPKGETEEKRLDDLLARNIDGIILFSYCISDDFVKKLLKVSKHTPLICSDSMFENTGLSCVFANGEQGSYDAANYLINSGRKRIAYVKGEEPFKVVERRCKGYRKALEEKEILVDDSLVYAGNFKKESGYQAAKQFMALKNPPDAIMASTDDMAVGVLDFLVENNFNVPDDVAIIGFNNQAITSHTTPSLSSVSLPVKDLAECAVNTLVQLIEEPTLGPVNHIFDCGLIVRQST